MEQLLTYLHQRAEGALRVVVEYEPGSLQPAYVREDIDNDVAAERTREVYRELIEPRMESPAMDTLGRKYASVHLRDEVVVLDVRRDTTSGVIIALDASCASRLTSFVQECSEFVRTEEHGG